MRFAAIISDLDVKFLLEAEVTDTRDVTALPGADGILALPVVAIATSCVAPLARARIAAAGFRAPGGVVTADPLERGKPLPIPTLLAPRAARRIPPDAWPSLACALPRPLVEAPGRPRTTSEDNP